MPAMKLNDNTAWEPDEEQIQKWISLYPKVDVLQELNAMCGWLDANPKNRKTRRGIARFCNAWLSRAQDRGGSPMVQDRQRSQDGRINRTRDMTTLDELTHDFMDSPAFRQQCLDRHGQYFSIDNKRVLSADL